MIFVVGLWTFLRALCLEPATVALENLALRHQLLVLQRSVRRPHVARRDRVLFSEAACQERSSLVVTAPPLSSSFGRTTAGRVPCSRCELCHPSLRAVKGRMTTRPRLMGDAIGRRRHRGHGSPRQPRRGSRSPSMNLVSQLSHQPVCPLGPSRRLAHVRGGRRFLAKLS